MRASTVKKSIRTQVAILQEQQNRLHECRQKIRDRFELIRKWKEDLKIN